MVQDRRRQWEEEECFKLVSLVSTIYVVITGKVKGDQ